ncbi:MAG: Homoserine O-succinyltransferase, partial [Gammaproteobacteria bacterium]|nr:Homoserine O-succinyltransferase [Gammaproteobacteria bacterium]
INNMPEAALEPRETQFASLLRAAAEPLSVRLRLSSLPEVPRGRFGLERVNGGPYWSIDELLRERLDALIVTGAEPCAPRLSDEPYWERLGELLRWSQENTSSSIWSCLAAHAAVEHLDKIRRQRLEHKRSGVFSHTTLAGHALLEGVRAPLSTPHSRWNGLPMDELREAGYTIASFSAVTGADLFTKQVRSLLVFFQGHPEYETATLLKEYRRDVGRFLRGQQSHYPTLPEGYFSSEAIAMLNAFQAQAVAAPSADLLGSFPAASLTAGLTNPWAAGATGIYRNWLALLAGARKAAHTLPATKVS